MGDTRPPVIYFDPVDKNLFEECGAIFPSDQKPGTLKPDNFDVTNLRPELRKLYAGENPYSFFVQEFRTGGGHVSRERMEELAPICRDPEAYLDGKKGFPCYWLEEKTGFPGWVCEAGAWTVGGAVVAEGVRRGIKYVRQKPGGGDPPTEPPAGSAPAGEPAPAGAPQGDGPAVVPPEAPPVEGDQQAEWSVPSIDWATAGYIALGTGLAVGAVVLFCIPFDGPFGEGAAGAGSIASFTAAAARLGLFSSPMTAPVLAYARTLR
ncbi:MAG: hypothetical protein HYU99_03410 [Deltaproteobacteria bacterium]|nr:hypothetical protein [Deltaproteobacteria bacterium]